MIKNVGKIDRILRFVLGLFFVWLGLFVFNGKDGNITGIVVAMISLIPFYIGITRSCIVFNWFRIHSLSKKECEIQGNPYSKD